MDSVASRFGRAPGLIGLTRRGFVGSALASLAPVEAAGSETFQATGVKVGEITPTSALIWARRTQSSARRADGMPASKAKAAPMPVKTDTATLEGSCPGAEGALRIIVKDAAGKKVHATGWTEVAAATDFAHQFSVDHLKPASAYTFTVETKGRKTDGKVAGAFRTAPQEDVATPIALAMLSCQKYSQRDDKGGFLLYNSIRTWRPHFYLSVGDNVYYDSDDPVVNSTAMARHHWHRMYSLPNIVECTRTVPGYWLKDDHDSYSDDCFPGLATPKMAPFTFDEGLRVFPNQVPLGAKPYRKFRWGRGLEVFLLEGRDYRSAHTMPDGPAKSIWGQDQKRWLKESLAASTAHWKLIISPTPIVGPDRPTKHDNHTNDIFRTEGREIRRWIQENTKGDTFVLCGDRHWQYHSIEPETKVQEFGCGAASDSHASGTPGEDKRIHQFHRVKGGFLALQVRPEGATSRLIIEHRDVNGAKVYGRTYERRA